MRRFESVEKNRFWEVFWEGGELESVSGAIGSNGRATRKHFASSIDCDRFVAAEIGKKLAAGFGEVVPEALQVKNAPRAEAAPDWIARIAAAFDDDAPRMVYADWLSSRGDPLGELIMVQCEREHLDANDARAKTLRLREDNLLANFRRRWAPQVDFPVELTFRRGFVDRVRVEPPLDEKQLAQLLAGAPLLRTLELGEGRGVIVLPWNTSIAQLSQLTGLSLRGVRLRVPEVTALMESPLLINVERLALRSCGLTAQEVELLRRPWRELDVHQSALGVRGVDVLLGGLEAARLELLDVGSSGITDAGARKIAAAKLTALRTLSLRRSQLSPEVVLDVLRAPSLANLRALDLSHNTLLAKVPFAYAQLPSLEELDLEHCWLGDAGLALLLAAPIAQQLRVIDLGHNGLSDAGAQALARAALPRMTTLRMSGNDFALPELRAELPGVRVTRRAAE